MSLKTTRHTATFDAPFSLRQINGVQPAGEYGIFSTDELITGLPRIAWRRVSTSIQTPSLSSTSSETGLVVISQVGLDAALMRDQQLTVAPRDA